MSEWRIKTTFSASSSLTYAFLPRSKKCEYKHAQKSTGQMLQHTSCSNIILGNFYPANRKAKPLLRDQYKNTLRSGNRRKPSRIEWTMSWHHVESSDISKWLKGENLPTCLTCSWWLWIMGYQEYCMSTGRILQTRHSNRKNVFIVNVTEILT